MVNEHTFRADLFFRLNVMPITTALRERKEDIELLATHFLEKYSRIYNTPKSLTPSAVEALMAYPWPGNVRELENIMERLVAWGSSEHLERADIESVMVFESDNPLDWYDPELTPLEKLAAVGGMNYGGPPAGGNHPEGGQAAGYHPTHAGASDEGVPDLYGPHHILIDSKLNHHVLSGLLSALSPGRSGRKRTHCIFGNPLLMVDGA